MMRYSFPDENFAEEDERDEDDRGQEEVPRNQGNKGKRSIDEAIERWIMKNHDFKEEIVETLHDGVSLVEYSNSIHFKLYFAIL